MTAAKVAVRGALHVHGREVEIIVKPGWSNEDLVFAASLQGAPVRITIEPASAPEQSAPVEDPPAHGSPLDYLSELKGLLTGLLDAQPSPSEEQTDRSIRRCLSLANSVSLGILSTQRGTR